MRTRLILMPLILAFVGGLLSTGASTSWAQSDSTPVSASTPAPQPAKEKPAPGPFARGHKRVGLYGGAGSTLGNTYFILGGGVGYYLFDGLELGIDGEGWLFQDPTIWKVTPQVRYTVWQMGALRPYLGAFWRRTYVSDPYDDVNSWGGRAGLLYSQGKGFAGVGVVYEHFEEDFGGESDSWYPEISFSVYF